MNDCTLVSLLIAPFVFLGGFVVLVLILGFIIMRSMKRHELKSR